MERRNIPIKTFFEQDNARDRYQDLLDEMSEFLSLQLERHHRETLLHSRRVADLTVRLAQSMGKRSRDVRFLARAALLHDIGKLTIPVEILDKPEDLNEQEWRLMDQHCAAGAEIVGRTKLLKKEAYIVLHHHRWFVANNSLCMTYDSLLDGGINLISVCDAYDALVSDRPYRLATSHERAVQLLESKVGTQFCPQAFAALLALEPRLLSTKTAY